MERSARLLALVVLAALSVNSVRAGRTPGRYYQVGTLTRHSGFRRYRHRRVLPGGSGHHVPVVPSPYLRHHDTPHRTATHPGGSLTGVVVEEPQMEWFTRIYFPGYFSG